MNAVRWKQRFENFEKAWLLLHGALDGRPLTALSDLEQEGVIQRFEYTFELAWKTLKDYLEYGAGSRCNRSRRARSSRPLLPPA